MALGTFSNGGLGFGLAFVLEDQFSNVADKINTKLDTLADHTEAVTNRIDRAFKQFQTGATLAGIGAVILAPFIAGTKAASDYEENINKLDVAFGSYAGKVRAFTDSAGDNFGIDKVRASDMASLFGDMSTGMGIAQKDAADMSMQLVGLAGDLASFKNISHEMAQTALKGIFTGETESLKNLGIVMTETNLQAYMAAKGINGKFKDLSESEKVMLRFNFVLEKSKNSIGDYLRTSEGFANSKRSFEAAMVDMKVAMGSILLPILAKGFQMGKNLLQTFNAFAESRAGKFILSLVAILGILLVVVGSVIMAVASLKLGVIFMTHAFTGATRAAIIKTIATQGLTAGLRQMAVAAWASLGPYALIAVVLIALTAIMYKAWNMITKGNETMVKIGATMLILSGGIGWIVLAIAGLKRGFENLSQPLEKMQTGGIIGFFTKFAAIISMVKQIWDSWNGSEFTLTEDLYAKLNALGIMPLAEKIGLIVVRIKNFFIGIKEGFAPFRQVLTDLKNSIKNNILDIWERLKTSLGDLWTTFKAAFGPMAAVLENLYQKFFGTEQSLLSWRNAGRVVGAVLLFIFRAIVEIVKFAVTLVSVLIQGIIWTIGKVMELYIVITGFLVRAWVWVKDVAVQFFNWIDTLPARMIVWGINFVMSILTGIKTAWSSLTDWIDNAVNSIGDTIGSKIQSAFNFVKTGGGLWGDDKEPDTTNPKKPDGNPKVVPTNRNYHHTVTTKSPQKIVVGGTGNATANNMQPIILQNIMDGEVISEKVMNKQTFNNSRRA